MTYDNSTIWWIQTQRQDRLIGFIIALSIHALLFLIGGAVFVKSAQFGVQSVSGTTEVSLVDTIEQPPAESVETPQPMQKKQGELVKVSAKTNQGVRIKGNPNYFQNPAPLYPELAKQMRQEGLVMLVVDVDREGIPKSVEIEKSSGYEMLDQSALKAVSHWRFQPSKVGDLPVESKVKVPIRFLLQEHQ